MRHKTALFAFFLSLITTLPIAAQGPMRVAPSGRGTSEVTLTLVDSAARAAAKPASIKVDFGQPHLRGRKLLTDSLVPYDKPWRTGANGSTTLTTDVDLTLGGATLPRGKYVLQTLPSRSGWKLLVRRGDTGGMAADAPYNPADDLARIDLRATTLPVPLESLSMWLIPARGSETPRGELVIAWGAVSLATDWVVR